MVFRCGFCDLRDLLRKKKPSKNINITLLEGKSDYCFRYYNPEAGRWLNRDPIGEKKGGA